MPMTIDPWSNTPLWQQLAAILRELIESGELSAGDQLPSELTLQQRHGVARGTVRHAIRQLRDEGLVVVFAGRGAFVTPKRPQSQG